MGMTLERGRNGWGRIEPRREEEIITPEKLGKMIAKEVASAMAKEHAQVSRQGFDLIAAASARIEKAAQLAYELCEKKSNEIVRRHAERTQTIIDLFDTKIIPDVRKALEDMKKGQKDIVTNLKAASAQTLGDIIGEEIRQYQLENMVKDALGEAIRETVRQVIRSQAPTTS
jgi:hypothetical protein